MRVIEWVLAMWSSEAGLACALVRAMVREEESAIELMRRGGDEAHRGQQRGSVLRDLHRR